MNKKPQNKQLRNKSKKQKTHKTDEGLRGKIRELESVIRKLQSRLKYHERRSHFAEDNTFILINKELEADYQEKVEDQEGNCPSCGKGSLSLLNLGRASYLICDHCPHREKTNHEGS